MKDILGFSSSPGPCCGPGGCNEAPTLAEARAMGPHLTFEEYLVMVANAKRAHPEWRLGQTYFNVLYEVRPDLSDGKQAIRASAIDPFYQDHLVAVFLVDVARRWNPGTS